MSIKQKWKMDKAKCTCWPGGAAVSQANNVWNMLKFPPMQLILISPKKMLKLKKLRNLPLWGKGGNELVSTSSPTFLLGWNPSTLE
jgi:hypothetical protein